MSVFHHELFHNQQRNISLHFGSKGNIAGKDGAWELFSEGTAVLASLVGQPSVQMASSPMPRSYLKRANAFIGSDGVFPGGLNMSYTEIPYHTALYWRFLYEQCGGIKDGREDPAAGMQIIRKILETLYSGEMVDINSSTSAVQKLPLHPRRRDLQDTHLPVPQLRGKPGALHAGDLPVEACGWEVYWH
jgi:hypothetical protein